MFQKIPVSVTMIASNEEDRIGAALESCRDWVDDIVVIIDDKCHDQTEAIALAKGARVVRNPWPGYGAQKRFAEEQARHEWVLNLDADERVSAGLAADIRQLFHAGVPSIDGYWIPTHDVMLGTTKISPYEVYCRVRLYNRTRVRFSSSAVHDNVELPKGSQTKTLRGILTQESLRSLHHWLQKMNDYTDAQVRDMLIKSRRFHTIRLVGEFWVNFLKAYFLKGFWRTGLIGYIYAMNFAFGRFLRQAKHYEALYLNQRKS